MSVRDGVVRRWDREGREFGCVSVRTRMWVECERAKVRVSVHLRSESPSMFKRKVLRRGGKRRRWGWDVVQDETVVIGQTEGGGGTCVEQEADCRVPNTVVSREDEGEKEEEVGEERENVETDVGVGSRCRY
jgi:hypothetical protein